MNMCIKSVLLILVQDVIRNVENKWVNTTDLSQHKHTNKKETGYKQNWTDAKNVLWFTLYN